MHEVLSRKEPYVGMPSSQVAARIASGGLSLERVQLYNDIEDIMMLCFDRNPNERPSFKELCSKLNAIRV